MKLELRYKLTRVLIRLLVKNTKQKNQGDQSNPTQPEAKHLKFYWVGENHGFYWIEIFTS